MLSTGIREMSEINRNGKYWLTSMENNGILDLSEGTMERMKIGIAIKNENYGKIFARGLSMVSHNMTYYVLGEGNKISEEPDPDVILSDLPYEELVELGLEQKPVIELSHEDKDECIFIFDDTRTIVDRIVYFYYEKTGKLAEYRGNSKSRLLVFCGLSGGCGVTSTALSVARMLETIYGSYCLYLNICPVDDSRRYLEERDGGGMLKLLYHLTREDDFPIESFIEEEEGLFSFATRAMNKYAMEIDDVLFNRLLGIVEKLGKYDYVIVDAGNCWSRSRLKILEPADCVVLVSKDHKGGKFAYEDSARAEIARYAGDDLLEVVNFAPDDDDADNIGWDDPESEAHAMVLSENGQAFIPMGGRVRIDLKGNYGLEIAAIAKKIVEVCNGSDN